MTLLLAGPISATSEILGVSGCIRDALLQGRDGHGCPALFARSSSFVKTE